MSNENDPLKAFRAEVQEKVDKIRGFETKLHNGLIEPKRSIIAGTLPFVGGGALIGFLTGIFFNRKTK